MLKISLSERCSALSRHLLMSICFAIAGLALGQSPNPELAARLAEVQDLQGRQRYVDALLQLDELEKSFPDNVDIYNLRGSIQLAPGIRDFDKAEAAFNKAASLAKDSLAPAFNLAELSFVKHDWPEAQKRFEALLQQHPKMPLQVRHLSAFKILICQLQTEKVADAEKTLQEHFTFMDDTPAYYFSKAALEFHKKDQLAAQTWLNKASSLFSEKHTLSYMDSLIEARWVPHVGLPLAPESL